MTNKITFDKLNKDLNGIYFFSKDRENKLQKIKEKTKQLLKERFNSHVPILHRDLEKEMNLLRALAKKIDLKATDSGATDSLLTFQQKVLLTQNEAEKYAQSIICPWKTKASNHTYPTCQSRLLQKELEKTEDIAFNRFLQDSLKKDQLSYLAARQEMKAGFDHCDALAERITTIADTLNPVSLKKRREYESIRQTKANQWMIQKGYIALLDAGRGIRSFAIAPNKLEQLDMYRKNSPACRFAIKMVGRFGVAYVSSSFLGISIAETIGRSIFCALIGKGTHLVTKQLLP